MIKMGRKQTTVLASIAVMTFFGAMLLLSGILSKAAGQEHTTSSFSSNPNMIGTATKIVVLVDSPYGSEVIRSFKVF